MESVISWSRVGRRVSCQYTVLGTCDPCAVERSFDACVARPCERPTRFDSRSLLTTVQVPTERSLLAVRCPLVACRLSLSAQPLAGSSAPPRAQLPTSLFHPLFANHYKYYQSRSFALSLKHVPPVLNNSKTY